MEKYFESLRNVKDNQGGFSLIELVVAVGILAILSVVGLVSYAGLTENARKTAVEAAAAEVYKGAVAYDGDGRDYKQAAVEWRNSTGNSSIDVFVGDKNSDGSFCVEAEMRDYPEITASKGAGCDKEGGSTPGDGNGGEDDPGVIVPPATAAECFDFAGGIITGYTISDECGADVVIPNTINGEAVVGIGNNAFNKKGLMSVELNKDLKTVGNYAFAVNDLKSVVLPDGLETIGIGAFQSNYLISVEFPSSVKTIDNWAFAFNELKSVKFNEGLETIGSAGFYVNNGLSGHVDFPSSLKSIGSMAFFNTSISSARISNNTVMDEVNKPFDSNIEITRY